MNANEFINTLFLEGKSESEIASLLTDALNEVSALKKAEEEKARQKKIEEEGKIASIEHILNDIADFLKKYYPSLKMDWEITHEDAESILKTFDSDIAPLVKILTDDNLAKDIEKILSGTGNKVYKGLSDPKIRRKTPDEIFEDFFRKHNI
jgi:hypothetical protein